MTTPEPAPFSEEWTLDLAGQALELGRSAGEALLTVDMAVQFGVIVLGLLLGWIARKPLHAALERLFGFSFMSWYNSGARELTASLASPVTAYVALWIGRAALEQAGLGIFAVNMAVSLIGAWILIRIATAFIAEPFWSRTAATLIWIDRKSVV